MVIRKNIVQTILVVVFAMVSTVLFLLHSSQQQNEITIKNQLSQLANIHSQISLVIEQVNWQRINANQNLLDKLRLMSEISFAHISSQKEHPLLTKDNPKRSDANYTITSYFYLPTSGDVQNINTLMLKIRLKKERVGLLTHSAVAMLIFWISIISLFLFYRFKWVEQLESNAKRILTDELNVNTKSHYMITNVIGQAFNQLTLNNRRLVKAKTELTENIRKTSYIDDVTELGNHLFFKAELQVRLHNHEEAESGLVVIISFANYESIGVATLTETQQVDIANSLRWGVEDIDQTLVARLKGEEFALLLPNFTAERIDQLCRKLIKQLSKSLFDKQHQSEHFVDIGISSYKQGFGYYNIMSEADMALRNAQLQGANNWYIYGEPLAEHQLRGRLRWQSFLRRVLDKREILLYSQNIYYFKGMPVLHREILSRIKDGHDLLPANRFLAMANESGLALEFDRQIIDGVIKQLLYHDENITEHKYSINLFTSSLLDNRFTSWLIGKLSSYPELNHQLFFDLPENQLSKNIELLVPVMKQLSTLGVRWCVEHFGALEEDLSYLDKAPISMVKVDRRIINNIHCEKSQQLLLTSIIVTMKIKGIKIFVEGVEKKLDAEFLKQFDIDGAQGYYFDKPQELNLIERSLKVS